MTLSPAAKAQKELVYHRDFFSAAKAMASRRLVRDGDYDATYKEHAERVTRIASGLTGQLGMAKGDRFGVMALNSHEYLELYHAAFLGAGIINPLNPRLNPKELVHILNQSGTEIVFVDATFAPVIDEIRAELTTLRQVVLIGSGDGPHDVHYDVVLAAGEAIEPPEPDEGDAAVLFYTGGTTGLPKGVLCSQRAEILNLYHIEMLVSGSRGAVFLQHGPMFHAASIATILGAPLLGGEIVIMPVFEPGKVIDFIGRYEITHINLVPTMIAMIFDHPDFTPDGLRSLTNLFYGASPIPPTLLTRLIEDLPQVDILQAFGMTEASTFLTTLSPEDHRHGGERLRSVGQAVPGVRLSIQDDAGIELPAGVAGEVCAKGGNLMTEYWSDAEATAEAFRGGWYHTGDMGYLGEDGYLYLVDRVKDMIVSGGENVYSSEVENAIVTHPGVAAVAVIGIPHDLWGEQVHAVVVRAPGATATEAELIAHARQSIAGYKVPKSVEFVDEIPMSAVLKPLKQELRKRHWEGRERAI